MGVSTTPGSISDKIFEQSQLTRLCHKFGIIRVALRLLEGQQFSTLANLSLGILLAIEVLLPEGLA